MTHGQAGARTRLYSIWEGMKKRCNCPTHAFYHRYGGRGIKVCKRWHSFVEFAKDVGPDPGEPFTLERKNNDKGYYKENVRWATRQEQALNRMTNRIVTYKGETRAMKAWTDLLGLDYELVKKRLARGWSVEEAFETEKRDYGLRVRG